MALMAAGGKLRLFLFAIYAKKMVELLNLVELLGFGGIAELRVKINYREAYNRPAYYAI